MRYHDSLIEDLQALAALLSDFEQQLESANEEDKARLRELQQRCILEIALLKGAEKRGPTGATRGQ